MTRSRLNLTSSGTPSGRASPYNCTTRTRATALKSLRTLFAISFSFRDSLAACSLAQALTPAEMLLFSKYDMHVISMAYIPGGRERRRAALFSPFPLD